MCNRASTPTIQLIQLAYSTPSQNNMRDEHTRPDSINATGSPHCTSSTGSPPFKDCMQPLHGVGQLWQRHGLTEAAVTGGTHAARYNECWATKCT
jgi:hypothetical protein